MDRSAMLDRYAEFVLVGKESEAGMPVVAVVAAAASVMTQGWRTYMTVN
jgi:hypothetical protein